MHDKRWIIRTTMGGVCGGATPSKFCLVTLIRCSSHFPPAGRAALGQGSGGPRRRCLRQYATVTTDRKFLASCAAVQSYSALKQTVEGLGAALHLRVQHDLRALSRSRDSKGHKTHSRRFGGRRRRPQRCLQTQYEGRGFAQSINRTTDTSEPSSNLSCPGLPS